MYPLMFFVRVCVIYAFVRGMGIGTGTTSGELTKERRTANGVAIGNSRTGTEVSVREDENEREDGYARSDTSVQ